MNTYYLILFNNPYIIYTHPIILTVKILFLFLSFFNQLFFSAYHCRGCCCVPRIISLVWKGFRRVMFSYLYIFSIRYVRNDGEMMMWKYFYTSCPIIISVHHKLLNIWEYNICPMIFSLLYINQTATGSILNPSIGISNEHTYLPSKCYCI